MKPILFFLLVCISGGLLAQTCSPGWQFYRDITIDNSAGAALTDYQVKVRLNTAELAAATKLNADGSDLRVYTEDCTLLPFWGDSLGTSQNTDVWVKLPTIAAGATVTIQVYYGRPVASSATDGDNTFLFFDDFSSGAIDPGKWETIGEFADFSVTDGIASYGSTSANPGARFKFARTAASFSEKVIFDYNASTNNSNGCGFSSSAQPIDRVLWRASGGFGFDTLNLVAVMRDTLNNGVATVTNYPLLMFPRNVFHTRSITVESNANQNLQVTRFANVGLGTENLDVFVQENMDMPGIHFILSSFSPNGPVQLDNIRVRQFAENPPSVTTGDELMATPSAVTFILDESAVKVYPNPATNFVRVELENATAVEFSLTDALGRAVSPGQIKQLAGASWELNVASLPQGVYYLQLLRPEDGKILQTKKLIIRE